MNTIPAVKAATSGANLGQIGSSNLISGSSMFESTGQIKWAAVVQTGVNFMFFVAALLTLFYLIWGGVNMIMSSGDSGKFKEGRDRLVFAAIGMLVVGASYAVWRLVLAIVGISALDPGI